MDEQPKRGRGRPPGSKNKPKPKINRAPGSRNGHAHELGLMKRPKDIDLTGAVKVHPHDILRLDPPDDSPLWALPLKQAPLTAEFREKKMRLFLAAFAENGVYGDACTAAGITGSSVEHWRKAYPQFEAAYAEAKEMAAAVLEREAFNRAVTGWEEPVYQGGELVGTIKKKSDRILELMLRARVQGYNPKLEMSGSVKSSSKVDDLSATDVESLLRVLSAAEERGLLAKPETTEGEFREVEVDTTVNSDG